MSTHGYLDIYNKVCTRSPCSGQTVRAYAGSGMIPTNKPAADGFSILAAWVPIEQLGAHDGEQ
jgi:hypothetical protein